MQGRGLEAAPVSEVYQRNARSRRLGPAARLSGL